MKYLFVLGRNPELSVAELESFFSKEKTEFHEIERAGNGLLAEIPAELGKGTIDRLGGTISIGEVIAEGDEFESLKKEIEKKELYNVQGNKLNYVLFDFGCDFLEDMKNYLKKRFREEKLKATEKKLGRSIKIQGGNEISNVSSSLLDEEYFVFSGKSGNYFGRITEKSDYRKIEERDMKKPVRRNELAISPRLAKVLINLSEVNDKGILLDPFCGIGVILSEALLQGIKVTGIDVDKSAIEGCKKNLEWFGFRKEHYRILKGDSSKINPGKANGTATEPDLGKLQKTRPSEDEAKKIISDFERLVIRVLKNLRKNVRGKIAFTAPLILSGKERTGCNFEKIAESSGLKISKGPIPEFRDPRESIHGKSIVGRDIVVMENQ